jgi:nitrogen regulatory protein PII
MKLLLITAINEFEKEVKDILVKSGAKSFTFNEVKGYKNGTETNVSDNWFASSYAEIDSLLFTVFIPQENVEIILKKVKEFNAEQETLSKVHVAIMNLEQQF